MRGSSCAAIHRERVLDRESAGSRCGALAGKTSRDLVVLQQWRDERLQPGWRHGNRILDEKHRELSSSECQPLIASGAMIETFRRDFDHPGAAAPKPLGRPVGRARVDGDDFAAKVAILSGERVQHLVKTCAGIPRWNHDRDSWLQRWSPEASIGTAHPTGEVERCGPTSPVRNVAYRVSHSAASSAIVFTGGAAPASRARNPESSTSG